MCVKYRIDISTNKLVIVFLVLGLHVIFFSHMLSTPCSYICYSLLYVEMLLRR
jgi:hypothetical protein